MAGYLYNVYGPEQVNAAANEVNRIAAAAPVYSPSGATRRAGAQADSYADSYMKTVNDGYRGGYDTAISRLADSYTGNKFSWNSGGSSEYQATADKYRREGERQQENVQGSLSSNTGGYSNSYAQAAGQRAYGEYMDNLAQKGLQIRSNARSNYQQAQENTLNQIGVLRGLDDVQYQRFRDRVQDSYDFMTYYQNKYQSERGLDMSQFQNELARWQAQFSAAHGNLANIRQLAEQQYEHNTLSADTQASIDSSRAQNDAYYNYLYSKLR